MKWSKAFNGSMATAALLLPMIVAAESHIQAETAGTATAAAARVNFKIVIPKVLYLRLNGGNDRVAGAETDQGEDLGRGRRADRRVVLE